MGELAITASTPSLPPSPYPAQMKAADPYIAKRRTANHPCPVCGKHYVNEGSLRKHLACHPETQLNSSLRMWPCSVCQAVFTHESGRWQYNHSSASYSYELLAISRSPIAHGAHAHGTETSVRRSVRPVESCSGTPRARDRSDRSSFRLRFWIVTG
jgi:ribosomal protein L37AE/L43A